MVPKHAIYALPTRWSLATYSSNDISETAQRPNQIAADKPLKPSCTAGMGSEQAFVLKRGTLAIFHSYGNFSPWEGGGETGGSRDEMQREFDGRNQIFMRASSPVEILVLHVSTYLGPRWKCPPKLDISSRRPHACLPFDEDAQKSVGLDLCVYYVCMYVWYVWIYG
jgi:hypothetical protein